jgi:hypothetical protein
MATRLIVCPSCRCHVKLGASSCPFCGEGPPADASPRPESTTSHRALTRAALLFAGASTVNACSSTSPVVFYGPAPIEDAGTDAASMDASTNKGDASDGATSGVVFYGPAPIREDAGTDASAADASSSTDASSKDASSSTDAASTDASTNKGDASDGSTSPVVFYGPAPIREDAGP